MRPENAISTKSAEIWGAALKLIEPEWAMKTVEFLENEKNLGRFNGVITYPSDFLKHCKHAHVYEEPVNHHETKLVSLTNLSEKPLRDSEKFSIKEILKKFNERAAEKCHHPSWDENLINPKSKKFSRLVSDDRKKYLMNLSDYDAESLDIAERYDRIRLLRQREANKLMRNFEEQKPLKNHKAIEKRWIG